MPALNPYFCIKGNSCTGVWSPRILEALHDARPEVEYEELLDSFGDMTINHNGQLVINSSTGYYKAQLKSLKLSNYALLDLVVI